MPATLAVASAHRFSVWSRGRQIHAWAWGEGPTTTGQWDPRSGAAAPVLPGTMHSGLLGDQAVGTLRSPEFTIDHRKIWIRVRGKGQVRVIVDSFTVARYNALLFRGLDPNIDTQGEWRWIQIAGDLHRYAGSGNHRAYLEIIDDDGGAHLIIAKSERIPPESVDPTIKNYHWGDMISALFEGLTRMDPADTAPLPALARSWEVSDDGLKVTLAPED